MGPVASEGLTQLNNYFSTTSGIYSVLALNPFMCGFKGYSLGNHGNHTTEKERRICRMSLSPTWSKYECR